VLSEGSVRAVKVWLLFKYLLTHREKALTTEEILTALWPGQEYKGSQPGGAFFDLPITPVFLPMNLTPGAG